VSQTRIVWVGLAVAALVVAVVTCEVARRAEVRAWAELEDAWQAWVERCAESDLDGQLTWKDADLPPERQARSRMALRWWKTRLVHLYHSPAMGSRKQIANFSLSAERTWLRVSIEVDFIFFGSLEDWAPWLDEMKSHFEDRGIAFGRRQILL